MGVVMVASAHGRTSNALRVPTRFRYCDAVGTVVPETTIHSDSIQLSWCCRTCRRDWPITAEDQQLVERRQGLPDRRQEHAANVGTENHHS